MDGKANLPNFTGDINWQGLEDLYRVNESVYEHRYNYRLSLADWTNYLKDVDRMFALLNSYYQQNKTDKANTAQSNRDGDESSTSTSAEMSSAEEASGLTGEELELIVPTDFAALALSTMNLSQERKLELNNDIPEKSSLNDAHWRNNQPEKWMEDKESDRFDMDFSGNGLIELESRHGFMLQPVSIPQKDTHQDTDAMRDIFGDQMYLPVRSDQRVVHQALNVSIRDSSISTQKTGTFLKKTEQSLRGETSQVLNIEGSASSSLSLG